MSTEDDTSGDEEAPERLVRQDEESDDTEGHKASFGADPDFSHNLALGRPDDDDEDAVEKHN
jgi:hypothetical protein